MEKYDLVVIGAGPGGYSAAIRSAQLGLSTALVEKEKLGGTCLNWGCIPTKSLIHSSTAFWNLTRAEHPGIKVHDVSLDYASMKKRKDLVVEKLRGGIELLLKANGVTVLNGSASFRGRNRIFIKSGGSGTVVNSAGTIIATGCDSTIPGFIPASKAVVESRSFLDLETLPSSLIVMGGGIIGCEFACMAAQLGVKVSIVEILPDILAMLDPDVRAEVRRQMERKLNIQIMTGKPFESISAGRHGIKGTVGNKKLEADMLLVAVGRRPVTDRLELELAGVTKDADGFIETDRSCRTRAATIYAVGDVAGGPQLAHLAMAQGLLCAERAAGLSADNGIELVPSCIFTAPEIGLAGLSEQEARAQNRRVSVGRFPFAASGKALAGDCAGGFVKWIADASTDQLLGAQAVGPHATELIAEASLAIRFELTARELARTIHSHPTLSEAWMEAANDVHGLCIHAPPRKRRKRES